MRLLQFLLVSPEDAGHALGIKRELHGAEDAFEDAFLVGAAGLLGRRRG